MSDFSLTLVLQIKTSKIINDMAKVQIKSEKITAFGGIFSGVQLNEFLVNEELDSALSNNEEIKKSFMLRLLSSC